MTERQSRQSMAAFGSKVKTTPVDKDHFQFDAEVSVSPTFFSWIFEFGGMIKIVGPENVKEALHEMVQQVLCCAGILTQNKIHLFKHAKRTERDIL